MADLGWHVELIFKEEIEEIEEGEGGGRNKK